MVEAEYSPEFLSKTILLQVLISIISNGDTESDLRWWAMLIGGRLLSKENVFAFISASSIESVLSVIDKRNEFLESQNSYECNCAFKALGEIGSSFQGAALILSNTSPVGRHVVNAAFDQQQCHYWEDSLHCLANIAGEKRMGNDVLLNFEAEVNLKSLIREQASQNPALTLSGLLLSALQQDEVRIAGYRLISGLVARPWCLIDILSKPEIIEKVTDTFNETTEIAMEAIDTCCQRMLTAITASHLASDPAYSATVSKLQEAVVKGRAGARKRQKLDQ